MATITFAQQDISGKIWTNGDIQYHAVRVGSKVGFTGYDDHEGGFGFLLGEPAPDGKMRITETTEGIGYSRYLGGTAEYKHLDGQILPTQEIEALNAPS